VLRPGARFAALVFTSPANNPFMALRWSYFCVTPANRLLHRGNPEFSRWVATEF